MSDRWEALLYKADTILERLEWVRSLRSQVEDLRQSVGVLNRNLATAREELNKFSQQVQALFQRFQEAAALAEAREGEVRRLEALAVKNFEELASGLEALRENLAQYVELVRERAEDLEKRTEVIAKAIEGMRGLLEARRHVEELVKRLRAAVESVEKYDAHLKNLVANFEAVYNTYLQMIEDVRRRERELAEREERLKAEEAELEAKKKEAQAELDNIKRQIEELTAVKTKL
ncbi:MAG: hypothetical protein ACPL3C_12790, partial [Pyrobaculum sp.]